MMMIATLDELQVKNGAFEAWFVLRIAKESCERGKY